MSMNMKGGGAILVVRQTGGWSVQHQRVYVAGTFRGGGGGLYTELWRLKCAVAY